MSLQSQAGKGSTPNQVKKAICLETKSTNALTPTKWWPDLRPRYNLPNRLQTWKSEIAHAHNHHCAKRTSQLRLDLVAKTAFESAKQDTRRMMYAFVQRDQHRNLACKETWGRPTLEWGRTDTRSGANRRIMQGQKSKRWPNAILTLPVHSKSKLVLPTLE